MSKHTKHRPNENDDRKGFWEVDWYARSQAFGKIASDAFPLRRGSESQRTLHAKLKAVWMGGASHYPQRVYGWQSWQQFQFVIASMTKDELRTELDEFAQWLDGVRDDFLETTRIFHQITFLTPENRAKHWPPRSMTRAKIVTQSRSGHSLFFPEISPAVLEAWLYRVMGRNFDDVFLRRRDRFYFRAAEEIGASRRKSTRLIRYEFSYDTAVAHAYPVNEEDVEDARWVDTQRTSRRN